MIVQNVIYTPWITKNGRRIYHKNGGVFRFVVTQEVEETEPSQKDDQSPEEE